MDIENIKKYMSVCVEEDEDESMDIDEVVDYIISVRPPQKYVKDFIDAI